MVLAALFEGGDPGDFAAVIEMLIEQQPRFGIVDHGCPVLFELLWQRHLGNRNDPPALQADGALVEHSRIDMDGHSAAATDDFIYGSRKSRHVIPVSVAHRDRL